MRKPLFLLIAMVIPASLLAACSYADEATPTSMCAFVVGDGQDGRDAKIKEIAFPGDTIDTDVGEKIVKYFPCNARNFIVNDGTQKNANGKTVGDRSTLTTAYTKEGTEVQIAWKAFWTINQTESVLKRSFYPFCYKYDCYNGKDDATDANYADPGWNGMLGENFSPAGDADILKAAKTTLTDASWKTHNTTEWEALAEAASLGFADAIRPYTGVADDLFCGSGNSGWDNPNKPGEGKFECSNVRFVIDSVTPADKELKGLATRTLRAAQDEDVNAKELAAAKAKYGSSADYWLGLQDTIEKCKQISTCVVTLGGDNSPSINVPSKR